MAETLKQKILKEIAKTLEVDSFAEKMARWAEREMSDKTEI